MAQHVSGDSATTLVKSGITWACPSIKKGYNIMMNKKEIKITAELYKIAKFMNEKNAQYAMLCTVRDLLRKDDADTALALLEEIDLGETED